MRLVDSVVRALNTLHDLNNPTHGPLTADQVDALRGFPGWGPVAPVFDADVPSTWQAHAANVLTAAGDLPLDAARDVVDTSFYTPAPIAEHMWTLLQRTGFGGGRVLDIGCGTGRFLDTAPAGLPIDYTGVDADPVATSITSLLHPSATIITGTVPKVSVGFGYSAAIGNVPFSNAQVYIPGESQRQPLHTACLLHIMRALRPGAYAVIATSRYVVDQASVPQQLEEVAEFVEALRLPSGAFPGTDTVVDVVVLRARTPSGFVSRWPTAGRMQLPVADGAPVAVSDYWYSRPDQIAGTMEATAFTRAPLRVVSARRDRDIAAAFAATASRLHAAAPAPLPDVLANVPLTDSDGRPEGSFHLIDGAVFRVVDGRLAPVHRAPGELRALITLRDAAQALIDAESDWDCTDDTLRPLRERAARLYRDYVATFGPLNRGTLREGKIDPDTGAPRVSWQTPSLGGFRNDPDAAVVLALECYDRDADEAQPAAILTRRVNRRPHRAVTADSPAAALAISRGEGGIDLSRIAGLLGLDSEAAAFAALGDLVFRDPDSGAVVYSANYLSGNVRVKLASAEVAAATDPHYARNVAALQAVQPEWLGPSEIRLELGSPIVTSDDVEAFCREVFGLSYARVIYEPLVSRWEVTSAAAGEQARAEYGTSEKTPTELLQSGLNGKIPVVTRKVDTPDGRIRTVRDHAATESAVVALSKIGDRFSTWLWEDPHRGRRLEHDYNMRFTSHVPRTADGSYLPMPRLAADKQLWPWQRDWIDHALALPAAYCAFDCGLGKTLAALGLSVTLREFGIANKPLIAVPLSALEHFAIAARQYFPTAHFLVAGPDDLTGSARRRLFAARCATGDFDAVIMTHEQLGSLPMPVEVERAWLHEQLQEARSHYAEQGYNAKRTAKRLRTLEGHLDQLRHAVNDPTLITFNSLGVDHITVDEAHKYRRLYVNSTSDGFSLGHSQRASDLHLKQWSLRQHRGNRPVYAAMSATPFTNSLAEAYVALKFCAPHRLSDAGVESFDAWVATFIRQETVIEVAPSGGIKATRRPCVVQNVPELRSMLTEFMFVKRAADVGIPLPEARFHTCVAEPSAAAEEYMQVLASRAEALRGRSRFAHAPDDDNMLKVCTDGRKLGLDIELLPGMRPEHPETVTKLVLAADNIAAIYHRTRNVSIPGSPVPGLSQIVMCDLGTPRADGTQTYGRLRALLLARGVPAAHMRFAHDAKSAKARQAMFSSCRSGHLPIIFGSTPLIGESANLQTRCTALHQLDLTWTPAAFQQRVGRAIRFGNLAPGGVDIFTYVTARTCDGFIAGLIRRKSESFAALFDPTSQIREMVDVGRAELSYAELQAAASGNPLLLRRNEIAGRIRTLRIGRATVLQNAVTARENADTHSQRAKRLRRTRDLLDHLLPHIDTLARHHWDLPAIGGATTSGVAGDQVLVASTSRKLGAARIELAVGRRRYTAHHVATIDVPPKVLRRDGIALSRWIAKTIREWIRQLPDTVARLDADIVAAERRADDARTAAATITFDKQAELDRALAELDALDEQIADTAQEAA